MSTLPILHRFFLASTLCLGSGVQPCFSQEPVLQVDGKVRTTGVSREGTRVIVERNGAIAQVLSQDVGRIKLKLDLQADYILSFQQKGCMTKELYFDTRVPEDTTQATAFFFPFLVTLEERTLGEEFKYAQPVGFIRYFPDKKDFGYDTNYMLRREVKKQQEAARRLIEEQEVQEVVVPSSYALGPDAKSTPKPIPNVQHSAMSSWEGEYLLDQRGAPRGFDASGSTGPAFTRGIPPPEVRSGLPRVTPKASHTVSVLPLPAETKEPVVEPDGRYDELFVEPTHVARVIRITEDGHTHEFRRVSHSYGETHYFCDGTSCGEAAFQLGVREE